MAAERAAPVAVLPARPQQVWGPPAVANFVLGGLGSGLYLVAAGAGGPAGPPAAFHAAWLGPALVLAGFAAVALEAGRPLRGVRVLARVRSSWMSRELWLGGAFTAVGLLELAAPTPLGRLAAALLAALFAVAQGFIPRRARGVAAWDVPVLPALFLVSALVSGLGLYALLAAVTAEVGPALLLALAVGALLGLLVWLVYLTWSSDEAFAAATRPLREGALAVEIPAAGYFLPFVLAALALALPVRGELAAALAGLLMITGQVQAKTAIVLTAGQLRPVTLAHLILGRKPS